MHRVLRAGLAVAMVVLSGCWLAPNQGPDRSGHNSVERSLTSATVATLSERWRVEACASTPRKPSDFTALSISSSRPSSSDRMRSFSSL